MSAQSPASEGPALRRIGLVVHPTRPIDKPLAAVRGWTSAHDIELVQLPVRSRQQDIAPEGHVEDCDVVVSIGGDGTMLAATRTALQARRPVLGIACGSLGALTSVYQDGIERALDRFARGDWEPRRLPALEIRRDDGDDFLAINDLAIVRAGQGQIRGSAEVDGALFVRFAGDGCIVSTAIGSSAYALAAGGPLLAPGTDAFLLTLLPTHGGSHPPLVIGADSRLRLKTDGGQSGARVELDGQSTEAGAGAMEIYLRRDVATLVTFPDQEPLLAGLRRRGILTDSPRLVVDDKRD
jgi:NAD+ kinase